MSQLLAAMEMVSLLAEVERVLPTINDWADCSIEKINPEARLHKARIFEGHTPDGAWHLVVVSFSIESQGFPPGSLDYEGIGRKGSTLIHFTRPLAEKVFKAALTRH